MTVKGFEDIGDCFACFETEISPVLFGIFLGTCTALSEAVCGADELNLHTLSQVPLARSRYLAGLVYACIHRLPTSSIMSTVTSYFSPNSLPAAISDVRPLNEISPEPVVLSPEIEAKLVSLYATAYGPEWQAVFASLDTLVLYKLSLRARGVFDHVMQHADRFTGDSCHADETKPIESPLENIGRLNTEVYEEIMSHLTMRDRLSIGRTAKKYRAISGRALQASITSLLKSFGLAHSHIRFMQTATGTVISGDAIPFLFNPSSTASTLLFVTPHDMYLWVIDFFRKMTGYACTGSIRRHKRGDGIAHSRDMEHSSLRTRITIVRSWSSNALDPLPYLNVSHLMGGITHYGLWHANPGPTIHHVTIPSAEEMNLGNTTARMEAANVLTDYHRKGWKVELHSSAPHACGKSFSCPSTDRHTADDGCMHLPFPGKPYGAPVFDGSVYPMSHSTAWSLGGPTYPYFLSVTSGVYVVPRVNSQLHAWATYAVGILQNIHAYLGPVDDTKHF
ncbi:hypothetical protein C8R43DRAFT_1126371 [Mycena crocata]|nr:hypothetical protein C8R43DRAFT_1126371 [Mycena crocata]